MSDQSHIIEALREQYGRELPVIDKLPDASELAKERNRVEFWAGAVGYQRGMLKTWDGKLLALIVIPAAVAGHLTFWGPKLEVAYSYAEPYVSAVAKNAVELSDKLVAFGNLPSPDTPFSPTDDQVFAAIIPETTSPNPNLIAQPNAAITLTLWRVSRELYIPLNLSSTTRYGGIFSPPGVPAIYAADSPLGAINEVAHHLSRSAATTEEKRSIDGFIMHQIEASGRIFLTDVEPLIEDDWSDTQEIGRKWVARGDTPILGYPSRFAPKGRNYVLLANSEEFEARIIASHILEPFIV